MNKNLVINASPIILLGKADLLANSKITDFGGLEDSTIGCISMISWEPIIMLCGDLRQTRA